MHVIMLVTPDMHPIPESVEVATSFGTESIYDDNGSLVARGEVTVLTATEESFREWLTPFDGFWITNNPMLGEWWVVHITPEGNMPVLH